MIEFEILARGIYRSDQLLMRYIPSLHMPMTLDIQTWMEQLWQEKLLIASQQGTRLFDAPLFRLVDVATQADETLSITVGNTSYKEYVCTRSPSFAHERLRQELSNALAVCSVIETSDGHILLDKRQGVDVYVGRYHVIGGFFERDLDTRTTTEIGMPDPFRAICREIREETGIQVADIECQYCLGVVYDLTMPHGELCFLTQLNISLAEVQQHRTPEDNEVANLHSLKVSEEGLREFILRNHGNISATGEPNLLLYGEKKFGTCWYDEIMSKICD